jgi:regulatory protein
MPPASDEDPYARGLALVAGRELSRQQVRERLLRTGFDRAAVDRAIDRLVADGAIDDRRFAAEYVRIAARRKGRGPLRIARELAQKGVPDDMARQALDAAFSQGDAEAALEKAIARHARAPLDDQRHLRRAYAALLRLGFSASAIRAALKRRTGASLRDDIDATD